MTNEEFRGACHTIWGYEWKIPAADFFSVNLRTVRRWANNAPVPDFVEQELAFLLKQKIQLPNWKLENEKSPL